MERVGANAIRHTARSRLQSNVATSYCSRSTQRAFSAYSARFEEESNKPSTSSRTEGASVFDELFADDTAFDRHIGTETSSRKSQNRTGYRSQSAKVPRSILGNQIGGDADELNQEWDSNSSSKFYVPSSSSQSRPHDRHSLANRDARKREGGRMTPEETKTFRQIFASVFGGASSANRSMVDDGSFGSTLAGGSTLGSFKDRNLGGRFGAFGRKPKNKYLSTVLSERLKGDENNAEEIEAKIDEAREEIVACQTASEVWQWAAVNVWGVPKEKFAGLADEAETEVQKEGAASDPQVSVSNKETANTDTEALAAENDDTVDVQESPSEVRFGLTTPYYAPVLYLLLDTLRERFRSPQSALAVIRVAKNLGPDSFVLGCSPRLYAEALRTRWTVLKDLQGARDTLREAKDTGILGNGAGAYSLASIAPRMSAPENEETVIRDVTREIKVDVRQHIADGSQKIKDKERPLAYEYQLQLLSEMDEMLGNTQERKRFLR